MQTTQKRLDSDLEAQARLPAETKELEALQHLAERSIGEEQAALNQAIREQAKDSQVNDRDS